MMVSYRFHSSLRRTHNHIGPERNPLEKHIDRVKSKVQRPKNGNETRTRIMFEKRFHGKNRQITELTSLVRTFTGRVAPTNRGKDNLNVFTTEKTGLSDT